MSQNNSESNQSTAKDSNENSPFSNLFSSVYNWVLNLGGSPLLSSEATVNPSMKDGMNVITNHSSSNPYDHSEHTDDKKTPYYASFKNLSKDSFDQFQLHAPSPIEIDEDFDRIRYNRSVSSELLSGHDFFIQLANRNCSVEDEILSIELASQVGFDIFILFLKVGMRFSFIIFPSYHIFSYH